MIEEPPPIVFAPSIERPSADIVERFRAPTSFIVDAMNGVGALDWRIKRIAGGSFVGVALTCDCGPLDNLAFMAALAESKPGDVFMVATNGYVGAAVTGDLLIGVARNRGAAGFVTDGLVRDVDDLDTIGLPVFAMGVTPNSPQRRGPRLGRPADRLWRRDGRRGRCGGRRPRRRCRRPARAHRRDAQESRARESHGGGDAGARARRIERAPGRSPRAQADGQRVERAARAFGGRRRLA